TREVLNERNSTTQDGVQPSIESVLTATIARLPGCSPSVQTSDVELDHRPHARSSGPTSHGMSVAGRPIALRNSVPFLVSPSLRFNRSRSTQFDPPCRLDMS